MTRSNKIGIRQATAPDWPVLRALLEANALPLEGAREHLADFIVAGIDDAVVGCAGLERVGESALLRSCAVDSLFRGTGIGTTLTQRAIALARQRGIRQLLLLTTTAEDFFPQFGFTRITREEAPEEIKASPEFQGACPAGAVVMRLFL